MSNSRYDVQAPISAGQFVAAYQADAVNDTDWHTLTSDEFYSSVTGSQLTDGLKFAFVNVTNSNTTTPMYIKFRARVAAGDGFGNTDGVIPVFSSYSIDVQALADGGNITSIAYKKAAGSDKVSIHCGFNR